MKVTERCFYIVLIITLTIIAIVVPVIVIQFGNNTERYVYLRPTDENSTSRTSFTDNRSNKYHTVEELSEYLMDFSAKRSLLFTTQTISKTEGDNPIHEVVLKKRSTTKPMAFIVSGLSANDWGSVSTSIQLLHRFFIDVQRTNNLLDDFSFHILPLLNPDGYNFSMSLPIYSNWKKNYEGLSKGRHSGHMILDGYEEENGVPKEIEIFKNYFIQNIKSIKAAFFLFTPSNFTGTDGIFTVPVGWIGNDTYKQNFLENLASFEGEGLDHSKKKFEFAQIEEPYQARIDQWVINQTLPDPIFVVNFLANYKIGPPIVQMMKAKEWAKDIYSIISTFLEVLHDLPFPFLP